MKKTVLIISIAVLTVISIVLTSCQKTNQEQPTIATIATSPVSSISGNTASSGGNITKDGGASIIQRGVVWSTSPNPTIADSQSMDGIGTGNYTSILSSLTTNTTYYVKAYATNSVGTAYGNELSFTTKTVNVGSVGSIVSLNCNSATNSGILMAGMNANGVSSNVSYTGGNGGTYFGQNISSTNVSGLTATLIAGSFANGNGSLTYSITGTPNASGTASFPLNIGGQNCMLSINVASGIVSNPGAGVTFNGYTYSSVVLGNGQEWMAENLRTVTYANGDTIPYISDGAIWWSFGANGACVNYDNDSQYETPYGKLYNWYAVNDPRNLCPTGWHVPTDSSWTVLTDYLGGTSLAGGKMKSTGTQYWASPNTDATNESGFSAFPGGGRKNLGSVGQIKYEATWWSSSVPAWTRRVEKYGDDIFRNYYSRNFGYSVRCLKD